ncbi:hypothetical protein CLF_108861 [Clonorchis sinensis]|uniref:Uncharacterized protein n=1 Tax=Clonorchis sinensis TaxID=79923 RepID=G7YIN1_CLOSI|nr:hypothetical protein CLF_108861 [Clonorchis sinensis]
MVVAATVAFTDVPPQPVPTTQANVTGSLDCQLSDQKALCSSSQRYPVENSKLGVEISIFHLRYSLMLYTASDHCYVRPVTVPAQTFVSIRTRSTFGISLPSWLTAPGLALLQRGDQSSKYQPLVEVDLLNCNSHYAHIAHRDGRIETVSLRRLAPAVQNTIDDVLNLPESSGDTEHPDLTETAGSQPDSSQASGPSSVPSSEDQTSYPEILEQRRLHPHSLRN